MYFVSREQSGIGFTSPSGQREAHSSDYNGFGSGFILFWMINSVMSHSDL